MPDWLMLQRQAFNGTEYRLGGPPKPAPPIPQPQASKGSPMGSPTFLEAVRRLFQRSGEPVAAPALQRAAAPVASAAAPALTLDPAWLPNVKMDRIVVHWTAGPNKATDLDRAHYHIIIQGDGTLVRGNHSIAANASPLPADYAQHTRGCNTGSIGVSLACMAGAVEQPFSAGSHPMTRAQWDRLPAVLAALCGRYGIPVTPRTVLSHAEVQGTLGITQRGKWDIARLAFDPSVVGAKACGDIFRARTAGLLRAAA